MKMKKILAATMTATMAMGISAPVMAVDPPKVDAPIFSFQTLDVVVPTTYKVAFNPEELDVKVGATDTDTSNKQILSKNYGILNKSNKDMMCTVTLKVTDKNTGANRVTFVDSEDDVDNAKEGEYKIHLTAIPANADEVQVGATPASATKGTTAADLGDVTMTEAAAAAVTMKAGENQIAFKLLQADYKAAASGGVELGDTGNDVSSKFEIDEVAADGGGITAFTFGGKMNKKADWTKLASAVEITSVYDYEVAPADTTAITNTGAMIKVEPKISVTTAGVFTITGLTKERNYTSVEITCPNAAKFNINAKPVVWNTGAWSAEEGGSLTGEIGSEWMTWLVAEGGDITLTLNLSDGTTKTCSTTLVSN